ncbi:MAG: hypothetical protein KDA72_13300, partial [Planctomycetales bacterium]|nr:hypothetical protein [Planctomycetales bacterium]
ITSAGVGAGATVTVEGHGGNNAGTGSSNFGVYVFSANARITSSGGAISVTGSGTSNSEAVLLADSGAIASGSAITITADSVNIDASSDGIHSAGGQTTIRPLTAGTQIDLGGADALIGSPLTLGLTNGELDLVSASKLVIGSAASGAVIFSSNIVRSGANNVEIISGQGIDLATFSLNANGGDVSLIAGGPISSSDNVGNDISGAAISLSTSSGAIGSSTNFIRTAATTLTAATAGGADDIHLIEVDGVVFVGAGGLSAPSATVRLGGGAFISSASDLINDLTSVEVSGAAILDLVTFTDTLKKLTLVDGAVLGSGAGAISATEDFDVRKGPIYAKLMGAAGLNKNTGETVWLIGDNSYAGDTQIDGGSLIVLGNNGPSNVSVNNSGTLGGTGSIDGTVTANSGANVAPGLSPGILYSGGIFLTSGSTFDVEIWSLALGSGYDQQAVTGTVNLGGATLQTLTDGIFVPPQYSSYQIIDNDGSDPVVGIFAGLPEGATTTVGGETLTITYKGGTGNDVVLFSPMPMNITGKSNTDESLSGNFQISLPVIASFDVLVYYTLSGTATQGSDYPLQSGTATITTGTSFTNIPIAAALDGILEPTENVTLSLTGSSSPGVTVGPNSSDSIFIFDKDSGQVNLTVSDGSISEVGDTAGQFVLSLQDILSNPLTSTSNTTVAFSVGGSATPGSDYVALGTTTAIIPIGSSQVPIDITALNDLVNWDDGETIILSVVGPIGTSHPSLTVGTSPATITISDPTRPIATVSSTSTTAISESAANSATFTINLDSPATDDVTLGLNLGGSATPTADYTVPSTTVVIPSGSSSAVVVYPIENDPFVEYDETIQVNLSYIGGNVALDGNTATATIKDDDDALLTVDKLNDGADPVIGPAVNGVFYVNLTKPSQTATTISYSVAGTANNTPSLTIGDYTPLSGTLVLTAGQTDAFITINVQDDMIVESDETVILKLESITAGNPAIQIVTTGNEVATLTITDADVSEISVVSLPTSVTEG